MVALTMDPASEMARPQTLTEQIYFSPMEDGWHERLRAALIHEYQFGPTYLIEPKSEPELKSKNREPRVLSMHPRAIEKREYNKRRAENGGHPLRGSALEKRRPQATTAGEQPRPKTPWKAHGSLKARVKPVVVKMVPRQLSCESCGREFGVDRQRHWFNENLCTSCCSA